MRPHSILVILITALIQLLFISPAKAEEYLTPMEQVIRKSQPDERIEIVRRIAYVIESESNRLGLNPSLIAALVWTESRFNYRATGKIGEVGLMQIRYDLWKKSSILRRNGVTSERKMYWIGKNVRCGVEIFNRFLNQAKGDIVKALYRYNSGKVRIPRGTSRYRLSYVNKVLVKMYEISEHLRKHQYVPQYQF